MAHVIEDRVRDTTTTAGVGTLALSGTPPTRYRSFGDACAPGDTIWIAIVHQTANEWEVTEATSDGGSALTRSVVLSSSNSGLLVNFSAGTKDVIAVHPADRIFPFEFTSAQKGLVPASGGGTTNFLRADGTFAVPPGTGGVPDGDKGDITVTAGGATWTIDNNVVSFAKFQDITTDRLLGRDTAASGDVEEISVGGGLEFTGSAGIQRSALTGDVTASAGSGSTSIANDAVTYAKMQNVSAASKLLGRGDSGAGDPQEITLGTNLSMSGTTLNATGGGGTPGGADTQVQFNDGGTFGGDSVFVWDKTNNRLTIGHTAALDVLGLGAFQVFGTTEAGSRWTAGMFSADANGPELVLVKSRNAAIGSHTVVNNGDELGSLTFAGSDGSAYQFGAIISAKIDGTPGAVDLPTRLEFRTTADGGGSSFERLRIDQAGRVGLSQFASGRLIDGLPARLDVAMNDLTGVEWGQRIAGVGANATGASLLFTKTRSTFIATNTIVQADDEVGALFFLGNNGTNYNRSAGITVEVDGTPGAADMPGRIRLHTTPDGSTTLSERLRIDQGGRIVAGGLAAQSVSGVTPRLQVNGATTGAADLGVFSWGLTDPFSPRLMLAKARGDTPGTHTVIQADDITGIVQFSGSDGTDFRATARIESAVDGTPGSNDMPGRLTLWTTSDGSATAIERLRIDSAGLVNVGWGGAGPTAIQFAVAATSNTVSSFSRFVANANGATISVNKSRGATPNDFTIVQADDTIGQLVFNAATGSSFQTAAFIRAAVDGTPGANDIPGRLAFFTTPDADFNAVERMRIDNAGRVVLSNSGSASQASMAGGGIGRLQVHGLTFNDSAINIARWSASTSGAFFVVSKSRGATIGDYTVVQSGDTLGGIDFVGADGTDMSEGAYIAAIVDGTPGAGDMPTRLVFATSADGSESPTERLRIKSDGTWSVNNNTQGIVWSDAGFDVLFGWDDSNTTYKSLLLADIATEGAPAAGDFVLIYRAEGDLQKVNWSSLPGAGGGISNVVEDTTPQLGGALDCNTFGITGITTFNSLGVSFVDEALDVLWGWDDSAGTYKNMTNAVIATEATPAAGDFLLLMGAEGDLRKVNWSSLPAGGSQTPWTSDIDTADFDLVTAGEALTVKEDDASTDTVRPILNLLRTSTGTPANGIGASLSFTVETAAGNNEIGATIEAVTTDVTSTSEDFDLVFKTMAAGAAAAERLRIVSGGVNISNSAKLYTDGNYLCLQGGVAANDFKVAVGVIVSTTTGLGLASDCALGFASTTFASGGATFDIMLSRTQAGLLRHEGITTQTNAVSPLLRLRHSTTGTAASGIGLSLQFEQDTGSDNYEIGATIEAVTTDVGAATEDFDLTISTMAAGAAAAERLRIGSGGVNPSTRLIENEVILTDGANVTLDSSLGNTFKLTAGGNRTIDAPTNKPASGKAQKIIIAVEASGADRTITLATGSAGAFRFGTDITALTATTSGLVDYIGCVYNDADDRWDVVSYVKGF